MNNHAPTLFDIAKKEKELGNFVEAFKKSLDEEIRTAKNSATKEIAKSPRCAIVSLSEIMHSKGLILSASHYVQEAQADAVNRRLSSKFRAFEVVDALREMIASGNIRFKDETVVLNEITLNILRSALASAEPTKEEEY